MVPIAPLTAFQVVGNPGKGNCLPHSLLGPQGSVSDEEADIDASILRDKLGEFILANIDLFAGYLGMDRLLL